MKQYGICTKCGEYKIVQDHHVHGYGGDHKDTVVKYCNSCDQKAHFKARKEGKCNLTHADVNKLSRNSYSRRINQHIEISCETIIPYVVLREFIVYNKNTGTPACSTQFQAAGGKKLLNIVCGD